jgi:PHD/YefM family antitoxin component YafN of YafNO toxin-antitoxin module
MTERVRKMVSLPSWAVAAIARADINLLIDRCEHETILIEQGDHPTVVMMSHDEWRRLIEARNACRKEKPDDKTA